jgi:hypothetical protein
VPLQPGYREPDPRQAWPPNTMKISHRSFSGKCRCLSVHQKPNTFGSNHRSGGFGAYFTAALNTTSPGPPLWATDAPRRLREFDLAPTGLFHSPSLLLVDMSRYHRTSHMPLLQLHRLRKDKASWAPQRRSRCWNTPLRKPRVESSSTSP